jgi:myo-inositol-1(or 4)-monophosphatase
LGSEKMGMPKHSDAEALERIQVALQATTRALSIFLPGNVKAEYKSGNHLVTEADRVANQVLRETLVRDGEGWLSEETTDDLNRLGKERVWIVDPVDGTREFVAGIPEWCVSIALVEHGQVVAGGVCNPATHQTFLGSISSGVTYNGKPCRPSDRKSLDGALILASRSEVERGEWERFSGSHFKIKEVGSVAYKLALVAAGLADATWTLSPKHEWDVAGGVALILAAGGFARKLDNSPMTFNNRSTLLPNLLAGGLDLAERIPAYLDRCTNG